MSSRQIASRAESEVGLQFVRTEADDDIVVYSLSHVAGARKKARRMFKCSRCDYLTDKRFNAKRHVATCVKAFSDRNPCDDPVLNVSFDAQGHPVLKRNPPLHLESQEDVWAPEGIDPPLFLTMPRGASDVNHSHAPSHPAGPPACPKRLSPEYSDCSTRPDVPRKKPCVSANLSVRPRPVDGTLHSATPPTPTSMPAPPSRPGYQYHLGNAYFGPRGLWDSPDAGCERVLPSRSSSDAHAWSREEASLGAGGRVGWSASHRDSFGESFTGAQYGAGTRSSDSTSDYSAAGPPLLAVPSSAPQTPLWDTPVSPLWDDIRLPPKALPRRRRAYSSPMHAGISPPASCTSSPSPSSTRARVFEYASAASVASPQESVSGPPSSRFPLSRETSCDSYFPNPSPYSPYSPYSQYSPYHAATRSSLSTTTPPSAAARGPAGFTRIHLSSLLHSPRDTTPDNST
eukprot:Rmarinus@m.27614